MSAVDRLRDLSLLRALKAPERQAATASLAGRLGPEWKPRPRRRREDALALLHAPTGVEFVAVPGGKLVMGLSEADIEDASEYIDWTPAVAAIVQSMARHATPVREVWVRPFLLARAPLGRAALAHLGVASPSSAEVDRITATALARRLGFRLPAEAEFEWLARDGGAQHFMLDAARRFESRREEPDGVQLRSRFGVVDLELPHWVEDDWHVDYQGAPNESVPWRGSDARGVQRGGFSIAVMQDSEELLAALASARCAGGRGCVVRLARDLACCA